MVIVLVGNRLKCQPCSTPMRTVDLARKLHLAFHGDGGDLEKPVKLRFAVGPLYQKVAGSAKNLLTAVILAI